jgi:hypothetical protein
MSPLLVFSRVYRLEILSVMLVFSIGFVNYCPSNPSLSAISRKQKSKLVQCSLAALLSADSWLRQKNMQYKRQ